MASAVAYRQKRSLGGVRWLGQVNVAMREMGLQVEFGSSTEMRDSWFATGAGPGGGAEPGDWCEIASLPQITPDIRDASRDGGIHYEHGWTRLVGPWPMTGSLSSAEPEKDLGQARVADRSKG